MQIIKTFIKNHAVLTYFILTFAISWSLILLIIGGPSRIPGTLEETDALLPIVVLAMVVGPSIAGLLMIGLTEGRQGFSGVWVALAHMADGHWLVRGSAPGCPSGGAGNAPGALPGLTRIPPRHPHR